MGFLTQWSCGNSGLGLLQQLRKNGGPKEEIEQRFITAILLFYFFLKPFS